MRLLNLLERYVSATERIADAQAASLVEARRMADAVTLRTKQEAALPVDLGKVSEGINALRDVLATLMTRFGPPVQGDAKGEP